MNAPKSDSPPKGLPPYQHRHGQLVRAGEVSTLTTRAYPPCGHFFLAVKAFGHWYSCELVRVKRTGSAVVRYTSGSGTTREKTVQLTPDGSRYRDELRWWARRSQA